MTAAVRLFVVLATIMASLSSPVLAQDDRDKAREKEIVAASQTLRALGETLEEEGIDDAQAFTRDVRQTTDAARALLAPVEAALKRAEESLALLGPAPKEGDPAEAEPLASERKNLVDRVAYFQSQRTRILAALDEGPRLLAVLSQQRLEARWRRILRRDAPLIAPSLWSAAAAEAGVLGDKVTAYFRKWGEDRTDKGGAVLGAVAIGGAFIFSLLMFGPARNWTRKAFTARIEEREPTPARRVAIAGLRMLTRVIPGIIGGFAVIETARAVGLLADNGVGVARAVWGALLAYLIVDGFSTGFVSTSAPAWRRAALDESRARTIVVLMLAIVLIVGAKSVFVTIANTAGEAASAGRLAMGLAAVVAGALLVALCLPVGRSGEADDAAGEKSNAIWPTLRFAGRILGLAIGAAAIAGHVNAADFVATRVYYLALLGAVLWFARAAFREAIAWGDRRLRAGHAQSPHGEPGAFDFWIGLGVDAVLLMIAAPALLLLAGFEWSGVRDFLLRALVGVRIGGVVISLMDILLAIFSFVAILTGTRLLQGGMQRGPLAHSRMDVGVQNSLVTLFGYAGLVVATATALSIAGVDLSNLALIAGALSVGIGFGLQSVVNNFVSGLILLFERPIKVGDWIVTNSGEGIVKKISVRSTELETFDRSAIIIPNAELVASTVTNWTHKNHMGRVRVPVGVAYDSDPELVRAVLLKCADDSPLVVRFPEPFVSWDGFGASSLDFELRCFLADIGKGLQARTELRYAIFRAFKENGIEFPYPQQDIHVRTWLNKEEARPTQDVIGLAKTSAPQRHEPVDSEVAEDE